MTRVVGWVWAVWLVVGLGLGLGGCGKGATPNVGRIDHDVRFFATQVQHRSEEPARTCHRAVTAAAVASANVLARLREGAAVSEQLYAQLAQVDQAMQQACKAYR